MDAENCFSDSLRGMSYISQSQSYAFKPGRGAVGQCWSTGCRQQVEIKKSTRFDEFHRSNIALDNLNAESINNVLYVIFANFS